MSSQNSKEVKHGKWTEDEDHALRLAIVQFGEKQ